MRALPKMRKNVVMNPFRMSRLVLFIAVLGLAACASQRSARDQLQTTLYDYSGAVRWNRFDVAVGFLDPEQLQKKPISALEMQRYEQIQVTGYYVKGSEQPSEHELLQLVELRYVNRHTQAEHTLLDRQRWRFDESTRRWWLSSGLPNLTQAR
jgi:hypothetical protein